MPSTLERLVSSASVVASHSVSPFSSFRNFLDNFRIFSSASLLSVTYTQLKNINLRPHRTVRVCVCVCQCMDLRAQLIVEQLQGGHPVIQLLGLLSLLPLDDLSACLYHRLHLPFHFTQYLVQFLLDTKEAAGAQCGNSLNLPHPGGGITHHALLQLRLHHIVLHAADFQHPRLAFDTIQRALALCQPSFKVGRLLKEPELCPHICQYFLKEHKDGNGDLKIPEIYNIQQHKLGKNLCDK